MNEELGEWKDKIKNQREVKEVRENVISEELVQEKAVLLLLPQLLILLPLLLLLLPLW
jgi:hypothetical protein